MEVADYFIDTAIVRRYKGTGVYSLAHSDPSRFFGHQLVVACEVDDSETAMLKNMVRSQPPAFVVWPMMAHNVAHLTCPPYFRISKSASCYNSCYIAHIAVI